MFFDDLFIEEKDGVFTLASEKQFIECLFTEDLVSSTNEELLNFIRDDFDRCGCLEIKNKKIISHINCAYTIFSIQKLKVENEQTWLDILDVFRSIPVYDFTLIENANDPKLQMEEASRFTPIRKWLKVFLGKDKFNLLTDYVLDYHAHSGFEDDIYCDAPRKFITQEEFKQTDISKEIMNLINEFTLEEKTALCALCESLDYKSVFLPIAILKGHITKNEYVSARMVIDGGVADLAGVVGSNNSLHQELYGSYKQFLSLCLDYSALENSFSKLKSKILVGEDKTTEFKKTFCLDVKTKTKEKYIIEACIKTIAAFLNTSGGVLYVGVSDSGDIVGIEEELNLLFNNNYDKFLLNFKDKLKTKFKNYLHTHIEYNLINAGKKKVLEVNCTKSKEAVFINENDFYVRTNPATEKLEGKELLNYTKHRF